MTRPITLPLAAGLQTELADQLVQPGSTLLHENMVHPQTGKARVRFGSDVLSTATQATIPSGGTLPTPWQLATLGGSLVRFNRAPVPLHTWAPEPEAWVVPANEGGIESFRRGPIKLDTSPVFAGTAEISDVDVGVSTDAIVCVFHLNTGVAGTTGTTTVILDRRTRRPVYTRRTGNGTRGGRVVVVGQRAVVAYESAGGSFLQVDSYNLSTYALAQQVTMSAAMPGTAIDMRVGSPVAGATKVAILYRAVTSGELRYATVDSTNLATNSTTTPRTTAGVAVVPDLGFGWMQDFGASLKFAIMIADTTNGVRTLWDVPAPTAGNSDAVATHVLDAGAVLGVRNMIGTTIDATATGVYRVLYEVSALAPIVIKVAVWTGSAGLAVQFRGVGIRSKLWQHSTNFYFMAAFDQPDQRTYFVLAVAATVTVSSTTFPAPLAVAFPRAAGGLTEHTNTPSAATEVDGQIYTGVTHEVHTDSVASSGTATGGTQKLLGADVVRIRHPNSVETEVGKPAEFLRSLFVPGGLLGQFDGATFAAASFAYYPPGGSASTVTAGNLEPNAQYSYRFVYRYMDHNGRTWRSTPSTPLVVSTTGTDFQFDIDVETLRLVDRGQATGSYGYQIEVYRTQANSAEGFFEVATITNDPTADTVSVIDNVADDDLGEQLYTDGNGLENQLLPSISWCVEHQGRLVCGEAGTGTVWYSNEADFNNGLIFNEALTFDVGDPSDPHTGGAVFGEQLFVFKGGKTYIVGGQGANTLGQGQSYTPRLIDGGVGCDNPQSIVVADDGVWFRSGADRAGIHRTNGGTAEDVGTGVRAQDDLTITSAVLVRNATEIRFYTESGTTLVWNWTTNLWGTNTTQPCLSATGGYAGSTGIVYARATDGFVMVESTTIHKEGEATYTGKIRSPWYQAGGLAAWQRIKRLQGVGDGGAAHTTIVRLYKDMATSPFQTATKAFDGTAQRWNWQLRPAQQKASAQMVEIEIGPHQPADIAIEGSTADSYDGLEIDSGWGQWTFDNGSFSDANVGQTLTLSHAPAGKRGTYTIRAVVDADTVLMSPLPTNGTTGAFGAVATIVLTPLPVYGAGPDIIGVALIPVSKDGMDKVPSARNAT